jgi:hypothetical protein
MTAQPEYQSQKSSEFPHVAGRTLTNSRTDIFETIEIGDEHGLQQLIQYFQRIDYTRP